MSRKLLTSEIAILIEAGATTSREALAAQPVWSELQVPPRRANARQWFNTDFYVELRLEKSNEYTHANGTPLRPHTLGPVVFVLLTDNGTPTSMELLEGEMFPKSRYKEEVRRIDQALNALQLLPQRLSTRTAPYLRIARLNAAVAFLIASTTTIQEVLPAPPMFIPSDDGVVEYRSANGHLLIDGVLTADPVKSPWDESGR